MDFTRYYNKSEIAEILDISMSTLRNWLNKKYYSDLKALGYSRLQKKLSPKQLNYLKYKIDLQPL